MKAGTSVPTSPGEMVGTAAAPVSPSYTFVLADAVTLMALGLIVPLALLRKVTL